jgi:hypothetical protein
MTTDLVAFLRSERFRLGGGREVLEGVDAWPMVKMRIAV